MDGWEIVAIFIQNLVPFPWLTVFILCYIMRDLNNWAIFKHVARPYRSNCFSFVRCQLCAMSCPESLHKLCGWLQGTQLWKSLSSRLSRHQLPSSLYVLIYRVIYHSNPVLVCINQTAMTILINSHWRFLLFVLLTEILLILTTKIYGFWLQMGFFFIFRQNLDCLWSRFKCEWRWNQGRDDYGI